MKLFVFGLNGKMGRFIVDTAPDFDCSVVGGFDLVPHPTLPTFSTIDAVKKDCANFDVIIDFSRTELLNDVLTLSNKFNKPVVIATTGFTNEQDEQIKNHAKKIPTFKSGNYSVGINLLQQLIKKVAAAVPDFDVEIIEKHHNQKVDSPSGTALMLANSVASVKNNETNFVYGREGNCGKRTKSEIGISAIRGGTIVGEHDVLFCGTDEVITISHSAHSRKVFAVGAIKAAKYICDFVPGKVYNMDDMLK